MAKPIMQGKIEDITVVEPEVKVYIYRFYPEQKQNQDTKWNLHNKTILAAAGVEKIEEKIADAVKRVEAGENIDAVLPNLQQDLKDRFKKLVVIGVRDSWAEKCIAEYKEAMAKKREANYPAFPNID